MPTGKASCLPACLACLAALAFSTSHGDVAGHCPQARSQTHQARREASRSFEGVGCCSDTFTGLLEWVGGRQRFVADFLVRAVNHCETLISNKCPPSGILQTDEQELIRALQQHVGSFWLHTAKLCDL